MLERAIGMDPNYAPTWEQLGLRYYFNATYSTGGETMFQRSNTALERALARDPNLIFAAGQLITNRVERGELGKAYEAAALVKRRPESGLAHFTLGYVLRYAGMLEESARECDTALALDRGNYQFRSCAWSFMELGKFDRAMNFVQLDAGSEWFASNVPSLLLREGRVAEAREAVKHMPATPYHRDLLMACLQGPTSVSFLNDGRGSFVRQSPLLPEPAMTQREGRPGTGRPLSSRIGSKRGPSLMIHLAFFRRFVLLHGLLLHLLELGLLFGCEHTVDLLV